MTGHVSAKFPTANSGLHANGTHIWVGASWDGAPVFGQQRVQRCRRGARALCGRCNGSHMECPPPPPISVGWTVPPLGSRGPFCDGATVARAPSIFQWGINGRHRSTECPHHRHFQPLVQRFSHNSSKGGGGYQASSLTGKGNAPACAPEGVHPLWHTHQRGSVPLRGPAPVRRPTPAAAFLPEVQRASPDGCSPPPPVRRPAAL